MNSENTGNSNNTHSKNAQVATVHRKITQLLRQQGYRLTEARQAVIELLCERRNYLGAYEIYRLLEERKKHTAIASIYRVLEVLESLDILQREEFSPGGVRYRLRGVTPGHSHQIICSKCGHMEEVSSCPLATWAEKIETESGYELQEHWLRFFGLCPRCRTGLPKPEDLS